MGFHIASGLTALVSLAILALGWVTHRGGYTAEDRMSDSFVELTLGAAYVAALVIIWVGYSIARILGWA